MTPEDFPPPKTCGNHVRLKVFGKEEMTGRVFSLYRHKPEGCNKKIWRFPFLVDGRLVSEIKAYSLDSVESIEVIG